MSTEGQRSCPVLFSVSHVCSWCFCNFRWFCFYEQQKNCKCMFLLYFNVSVGSLCIFVAVCRKEMLERVIHAQRQEHPLCWQHKGAGSWIFMALFHLTGFPSSHFSSTLQLSPVAHRLRGFPAIHGDLPGEWHPWGAVQTPLHLLQEQEWRRQLPWRFSIWRRHAG